MASEPGPRLFHASDTPHIARFEPRPVRPDHPLKFNRPVVWAVEERLLHNYLLPRDCPRVTFYARPGSALADVARLMGQTPARYVVAVEAGWLEAIRDCVLYLYEFSSTGFAVVDSGAGHYVSEAAVTPLCVTRVPDVLGAMLRREVELRLTPSLWPLHDAVVASTLQFSCIRMRNARPAAQFS